MWRGMGLNMCQDRSGNSAGWRVAGRAVVMRGPLTRVLVDSRSADWILTRSGYQAE